METINLFDAKQYIPQVAKWIYSEFIEDMRSGISLDHITHALHKRNKDNIPITYIGLLKDECIGTISLVSNDLKERRDLKPWLAALYITADYRNCGYAQLLINTVIETSIDMGFDKLYLRTETAAHYYRRFGWKKIYETIDEFDLFTEVFEKDLTL